MNTETGTRNLLLLSRIETCYVTLKAKNVTKEVKVSRDLAVVKVEMFPCKW